MSYENIRTWPRNGEGTKTLHRGLLMAKIKYLEGLLCGATPSERSHTAVLADLESAKQRLETLK